jgi:membrane protein implicated in regulation of membrane protease activity
MEESQKTAPVDVQIPEPGEAKRNRNLQIAGLVLIALVVLVALIAIGYGLVTHPPFTAVLADISIIVLALVTVVIGLFLIILIFQLQSLTALLRDEIKPILDSANQTANTVRGTTTFVSDAVVTPMIQVASFAAGVGRTLRVLTGADHKRKRQTPPPPAPGQ